MSVLYPQARKLHLSKKWGQTWKILKKLDTSTLLSIQKFVVQNLFSSSCVGVLPLELPRYIFNQTVATTSVIDCLRLQTK